MNHRKVDSALRRQEENGQFEYLASDSDGYLIISVLQKSQREVEEKEKQLKAKDDQIMALQAFTEANRRKLEARTDR